MRLRAKYKLLILLVEKPDYTAFQQAVKDWRNS